ncbi:Transcriptional regulatory protein CusR [Klebsiella pneumoniae]|nr:Transcriptional regulatory protein CusR [Klebsiella pneumoniae]
MNMMISYQELVRTFPKIDNDYGTKLIQTVRGVGYMLEIPDA